MLKLNKFLILLILKSQSLTSIVNKNLQEASNQKKFFKIPDFYQNECKFAISQLIVI